LRIVQASGLVHIQALDLACACGTDAPPPGGPTFTAEFRAEASGQATMFVNDAVIGLGLTSRFYDNNRGEARVAIEPLPPPPNIKHEVQPAGR
jgi:hypothetical protein